MTPIARMLLVLLLGSFLLGLAGTAWAADASTATGTPPIREALAVMDFESVGASKEEVTAITDRMREALVQMRKIPVVDRSQIDQLLSLQADQQATCTGPACQANVGKMLGVNRLVTGRVTKFAADAWQIYATLVNVETAETIKVDTIRMRGDLLTLLDKGIPDLAEKLLK